MKTKIYLILSICLALFNSCEYTWNETETVFITNETSDSIKVAIWGLGLENDTCYFVEPNAVSYKLTDFRYFFFSGRKIKEDTAGAMIGLLIYSPKDSLSIYLNNGHPNDVEKFYQYVTTISDIDNSKRFISANTNIIVNEALLGEMTKNTALTDSIFGLK
jgi:hypothetical protein